MVPLIAVAVVVGSIGPADGALDPPLDPIDPRGVVGARGGCWRLFGEFKYAEWARVWGDWV